MVNVGDKVFVAPVDGQKDNLAVITGPAGGTGSAGTSGIIEGDYNLWTKEWINAPSSGIYSYDEIDIFIDDKNEKLSIMWEDKNYKVRFGIYNISDFSAVFESPVGSDYLNTYPYPSYKAGVALGMAYYYRGGVSQSIQTYLLFVRHDLYTLEVWQGGASAVWTTNTQTDSGLNCKTYNYGISLTGKYIIAVMGLQVSPYTTSIMLYKGFDAGTSTDVTETVITDISKAWAANDLIGHIVYITSGGANEQQATITSNTGVTITCSAATFVTWGMSVGDTFKID